MTLTTEQRWKYSKPPTFHFSAGCWINDPCAPGYDPRTKTYHLFYQCNPTSCEWGNMSWGHVVSKDLLTWTPAQPSPALLPDQTYDSEGVFTGCWIDTPDNKTLAVAYSSVKHLPFHWSTPPYPRDAAGLSVATSRDGGRTWEKSARNPILAGEPAGLRVTGFRDPFVTASPELDRVRGGGAGGAGTLYGLISGGVEGSGPTTFLYEIRADDIGEWKYLGPLVDVPERFQPEGKWGGNYGLNWECTNLVTLRADDTGETREFLVIGAEGDVEKKHVEDFRLPVGAPSRTVRAQLWMAGRLEAGGAGGKGEEVKFRYEHGGFLDHGPYYAANSFLDPESGRRVVYGWIPEEDISPEAARWKGWNGALAVPREIFLLRIPNVLAALRSRLEDMAPFESKVEADGSTTLLTLGVRPIAELAGMREASHKLEFGAADIVLPQPDGAQQRRLLDGTRSGSWEMEATVAIRYPGCETVGFHLRHSEDLSICTTVVFSTATETITVVREASNADETINRCPDAGPFTLLKLDGSAGGEKVPVLEKLRLRIFCDGDVLEVFANDRFALATMVYSDQDARGLTAFATGDVGSAVFETVTVWDGLEVPRSRVD
ncbi:Arabinanase/levansucrase/invertase [Coniochaeta ligniaria NRRL 30616]|uniref:Arabinanase/levansucrase/invertase n=1 Tax=Coniochaeta ligniaria NRRL 30616 TaxID=1408157 RepID=A0A1J7J889_9PEZI|nr:Arabinanase/levansucrase/invertase [Coniochaeta ligniaria NRRL 30616]